jgi:hypothetical protein
MSREELLLKSRNEVVELAKEKGISQYHSGKRKTKEHLVDEILSNGEEAEKKSDESVNDDEEWQQPNVETKTDESEHEEETENNLKEELTDTEREARKKAYVENVKIGTLVAFTSYTGKVKSAKVIKKSTKNRKLKVETKYGAQFIITFDDVIWVRTNKRWPRGVYQLLKGVVNDGEEKG